MRRYAILLVLLVLTATPARAAAPDNDSAANATAVSVFPASIEADTSQATTGPFEQDCGGQGVFVTTVHQPVRAVWYLLDLPEGTNYLDVTHDDGAEVVFWQQISTAPTGDPILSRFDCHDWYPPGLYPAHGPQVYMSVGSSVVFSGTSYSVTITPTAEYTPSSVPNDVPYRATKIGSLPYSIDQDATAASFDYDPEGCPQGAYVWYSYTPAQSESIEIKVTSRDSFYGVTASAYALGDTVTTLGCDSADPGPAVIDTPVDAGVPVLIGVGPGARISLDVHEIVPTHGSNPDARADATALPFGATLNFNTTAATLETGEPTSCGSGGSIWFALPSRPRGANVEFTGSASVAAIAGDSVLACSTSGSLAIPAGSAATYLQVRSAGTSGTIGLRFEPGLGTQITGASPFGAGCGDPTGTSQLNSEVEVSQTVDPHDANHLIVAYQQDRYTERGGSHGIGAAATFDGGRTWTTSVIPGVSLCSGGPWVRATDPWTAIDADGTTYVMSLGYDPEPVAAVGETVADLTMLANSVLINRSTDGGLTWTAPTVVAASPAILFNDKETLTADPNTPGLLYAVWDLYPASAVFPVFSRSEDGGQTWTPPAPLPNAGAEDQIAVLSDGTLVDIAVTGTSITSHDRGTTWSSATRWGDAGGPEGPPGVRGGAAIPSVATDGHSVFVSWSDSWWTYFSRSDDQGAHWNQTSVGGSNLDPMRSTTAVASPDGVHVAVMTYVVRPDYQTTLTLGTSSDGGQTWSEQPVADAFDISRAAYSNGRGYFLGDYFGLSVSGDDVVAAFGAVPPGSDHRVSNVYSIRVTP